MKKSIIGSLIGIAIVVAADTMIRVILSLALQSEVTLFGYAAYPDFLWGFLICFLTLFTSFAGGAFSITYTEQKKRMAVIFFGIWLIAVRYGQIHLVMAYELFLPVTALVLSLIGVGLAWKFFFKKRITKPMDNKPPAASQKKHHQPGINES